MASVYAADNSATQIVKTDDIVITVNVNTASAEEISTLLKGVGLKKAQAIVEYRDQNGPFVSKDELTKVKGIGAATVKKNEDRILL
ncbi:helix-hairpin-helix domain-containing protein [Vibrio sp. Y2-5]|uniref:ComEA family DNA-binding protein n=1 Tax=Vibrio TaxID=662 RepID=UPI00142DF884|nr:MULTISPECIES: helix-hairpin-helix domain-containing protein [Vibrio]MBD0787044.1 helix-hairpin-helix domain-containing protein [Vibrio sp. Y2-5]NIY93416.1 helix-hairpin-helix domain-containing protein [Vibrio diazotrophicus]